MLKESPIPRLWGLCVLSTSTRIYCGEKESNQVNPQPIPHSEHSTPIIPPTEWDLDLLSQEGFDKMKNIVADISKQTGEYDLFTNPPHSQWYFAQYYNWIQNCKIFPFFSIHSHLVVSSLASCRGVRVCVLLNCTSKYNLMSWNKNSRSIISNIFQANWPAT